MIGKWIARFTVETGNNPDRGFVNVGFEVPTPNLMPISPNDCEHGSLMQGLTISQRLTKTDGKFTPDPQGPIIAYLDLHSMTLPKLKERVEFLEFLQDDLDHIESQRGEADSFGRFIQRVLTTLNIDRLNIGKSEYGIVESTFVLDYQVKVVCDRLNGQLQNVAGDQLPTDQPVCASQSPNT